MIFRDLEKKIVEDINTSGLPIDAIYYIMKSIMQEVSEKYFIYCNSEDAAAAQAVEESSSDAEESILASEEE